MKKLFIIIALLAGLQSCMEVQRLDGWKTEEELYDEWAEQGYPHRPVTCVTNLANDRWCRWGTEQREVSLNSKGGNFDKDCYKNFKKAVS